MSKTKPPVKVPSKKKSTLAKKVETKFDESTLKDKTYSYRVESNIALTTLRSVRMDLKFPFALMNVGDSFLIPVSDPVCKNPNTLHYAAKQYAKFKTGFMITSRMQLDGNRRVWRIK